MSTELVAIERITIRKGDSNADDIRSCASVLNHTSIMGLVYQKRSMWTADEEKVLLERFPEEGASESLQKTLNRTSTAIYCKAMRLGCQKPAQKNRK